MLVNAFPALEDRRLLLTSALDLSRADGHIAHPERAALDALASALALHDDRWPVAWPSRLGVSTRLRRFAYGLAEWMSRVDGLVVPAEVAHLEALRVRLGLTEPESRALARHAAYVDEHTRGRALVCPWQHEIEHLANRILCA
jgi:hypothetical protein